MPLNIPLSALRYGCLAVLLAGGHSGCGGGTIPGQYVKQAEPGATLTALSRRPETYQGKVVILGGVIISKIPGDNRVWLRLKNRPLDDDYVPHIPVTNEGTEAGHYWVMVLKRDLPVDYERWARVTVVGRVMAGSIAYEEGMSDEGVVLSAMYLRGWDKKWGGYLQEEDNAGLVRPPVQPKPLQKNSGP